MSEAELTQRLLAIANEFDRLAAAQDDPAKSALLRQAAASVRAWSNGAPSE